MIRVTVDSIRVSLLTQHRVVVLRETDSPRYLPIFIGPFEADAIAMALQGLEAPRPMTHDLLKSVFVELGATIMSVQISDLRESTFYAKIIVQQGTNQVEVDSRPSDAIALAVRADIPIYVDPQVFAQASAVDDDDSAATSSDVADSLPALRSRSERSTEEARTAPESDTEVSEENLGIFRDFINSLDIDDEDKRKKDKK